MHALSVSSYDECSSQLIRAIEKCSLKWKDWSWYFVLFFSLPFLSKQVARQGEEEVGEEVEGEEVVGEEVAGEGVEVEEG